MSYSILNNVNAISACDDDEFINKYIIYLYLV